MRLTTVTRMTLPDGVVHRFATDVTPVQDGYLPLSFDQARHAGLGPRAGSWMAVAFALPDGAHREQVGRAWTAVLARHGTLRTVIEAGPGPRGGGSGRGGDGHGQGDDGYGQGDDDELRLRPVTVQPAGWRTPSAAPGEDPRAVLRRVFDEACSPFARPAHALCLVQPRDGRERPVVVIGLDHSHVDAWSLLVLMRDLCTCLSDLARGLQPGAGLTPAAPFAEHTLELARRPPAPPDIHRRWAQIMARGHGDMPVFPLDLGDISTPRPEVVEVRDVLDTRGVAALERAAAADGVRMIAVALSEMTAGFRRRGGTESSRSGPGSSNPGGSGSGELGLRAVLPVHSRHDPRWHDSVGWFITNSVIECSDPDPRACAAAVRDAVELGSYSLEPILRPFGGMPHTPGMFAISWLDHRRLQVDVDPDLQPQHVSATIRTTGVMVWFVVNEAGLHVRCRYPDTARARESVGGWLDELCAGLAGRALGPEPCDPDSLSPESFRPAAPSGPRPGPPAATPRPATVRA